MPLRPTPVREIVRKLQRAGFAKVRQTGGHARYRNDAGRSVTVPVHPGDVDVYLLRQILNQAGLTIEEWDNL